MIYILTTELYHHGIKGQKWGVRRFQNPDGTLTEAGKKRYKKETENNIRNEIASLKISQFDITNHGRYQIKQKYYNELFNNPDEYKKEVDSILKDAVDKGYFTSAQAKKNRQYYFDPDWPDLRNDVADQWIDKHPDKKEALEKELKEADDREKNFRKRIMNIGVQAAKANISEDDLENLLEKANLRFRYDALASYEEYLDDLDELTHHGIKGQHWGVRNGPPYPLSGGVVKQLRERRRAYLKSPNPNSEHNKKHVDSVIKKGTELATLSFDKDRTQDTDMFFASYKNLDKHSYNAWFNYKVPETLYDEQGNEIGTGEFLKYRIRNNVNDDIKVASEDSGAKAFISLYSKDRDFYNYVTDPTRMKANIPEDKLEFPGYKQAVKVLDKLKTSEELTSKDVQTIYRLYNYSIPADGAGNAKIDKDVKTQRAKFFKELSKLGYDAVLDTNDAIYGKMKATAPVIVFNMDKVALSGVERTTMEERNISRLVDIGRMVVGI